MKASAMKEAISKYDKLNICLEYTAMVNTVPEIEKKITKKKKLLVCVDAEVDAVDLEETLQESMTVGDDMDNDDVEHVNDDIATL